MNQLAEKSKENIASAKILIDKKKFNSSIHCSYYSCYQLIMLSLERKDLPSIENNASDKIKGSHAKLIKTYFSEVITIENNAIERKMSLLRKDRNTADYKEESFDLKQSEDCLKDAIAINNFIQKNI